MSMIEILKQSLKIHQLILYLSEFGPPQAYLAAGCIVQTIWNAQAGNHPEYGILDYDIVYYDEDLSLEKEALWIKNITKSFPDLTLDIKNQARVHLWYPDKFGIHIDPFESIEASMRTWPSTATATAVRIVDQQWQILAPFGTQDLLAGIIRPNLVLVSAEIFHQKAERWLSLWPHLCLIRTQ